jgi:predicted amidohydrolase
VKQGGFWGSTPCLAIALLAPLGGWVSDRAVARFGKRRGRQSAVWLGAACSAGLMWAGGHTENNILAILLLAGAAGFNLFATTTWWAACNDLTKRYSGSLSGFMNMFGNLGGWLSPIVTAAIATRVGWNQALSFAALVTLTAGALFADLTAVHRTSGAPPLDVAIGFYEAWRHRLYNSALYAGLGGSDAGIRHVHRKVFLPTYGVFDEERFVEAGHEVRAFDTRWGRAALLICEDAWHSLTATLAALGGAELVIVLSATPARGAAPQEETVRHPANVARWERIARGVSEEHGVWTVVSHLVGFEGGKGFAGGSLIAALSQGIMLGALIQGIKVDGRAYAGGWFDWLTPFSVLTAVALLSGYVLLSAGWLIMKGDEALRDRKSVV